MKTYEHVRELLQNDIDSGMSLRAVCRKVDLHPNTVGSYLEGRSRPDAESLEKIANAYNVAVPWLMGHIKDKQSKIITSDAPSYNVIPVITKTQAGDNGFWEDCYPVGSGLDSIPCPADITDPHAFAFLVDGDSMKPYARHGWKVVVDTTKTPVNGDEVVVRLTDGRVMLKVYRKMNGIVLLESYNSEYEPIAVKPEDIVCCFVAVASRR